MKKILIVNSNYYQSISNNLLENSKNKLIYFKSSISVITVPGIFEIPFVIAKNIKTLRLKNLLANGVIEGSPLN